MSVVRGARALAWMVTALAITACASTADSGLEGAAPAAPYRSTTVRVQNNNWQDVNVYVLRSGSRFRLGTVPSVTERTFRLPSGLDTGGSDVELLADPIGSTRTHATGPILFSPGDQIVWKIENHLPLSSYTVRPTRR